MKHRKKLLLLAIFLPLMLQGCDYALFAPKGPVAEGIRNTLFITVFAMLLVVIPTLLMIFYFPHRYSRKHKNVEASYKPNWDHSRKIEFWSWGVPITIIAILATITFIATHKQDPQKPLKDGKPLVIDVISFDYKWFFMYPEQKIAAINEVYFPVNQNIEFHITSDATMNSFFIPRLAGQIYAMAGMNLELNLLANEKGVYKGMSSNYGGYGFAQMKFKAHAVDESEFNSWVAKVNREGAPLSKKLIDQWHADGLELENYPTHPEPVTYFKNVDPGLFGQFIKDTLYGRGN